MKRDPYLASHWPASKVRRALRRKNKKDLIAFLRARYYERFFQPIRCLKDAGNIQGYGIAMMSLCSLLVESIQCCRDGLPSTYEKDLKDQSLFTPPTNYEVPKAEWKKGRAVFQDFFAAHPALFPQIDGGEFYASIRNGLLHQAQTKNGWTIRVDSSTICDPTTKVINRDLFADRLEDAFKVYLDDLRKNRRESDIWKKARRKIWWLICLSA